MTDYILLKGAERYLSRMQPDDQVRIVKALDTLAADQSSRAIIVKIENS